MGHVRRRPDRHHAVNPALIVSDVAVAVEFLVRSFDAVEARRMSLPNGAVMHAEVVIDDSLIMVMAARPGTAPMPCSLGVYVDDVDAAYQLALGQGARSLQEPADQFYGHRTARVEDPAGNQWTIHTVIEIPTADDILRRAASVVAAKRRH